MHVNDSISSELAIQCFGQALGLNVGMVTKWDQPSLFM